MKVSVLINNYNYARYLDQCIVSVLNQTYKSLEIILYDDGSTDNSLEVAKKYKQVKIISKPNFGGKPAFNQGNAINQSFSIVTGDIICLLDSDDFFAADKLEKIIKAFETDKEILLVQDAVYLFINGEVKGTKDYSIKADYLKLYYKKKWTSYFNPTSTLSFRREYLEQVLPIKEDALWRVWPDVRLSRIVPFYGKVLNLHEPLTYYRRHTTNDSAAMNKSAVETLKNQIAHHKYVNTIIKKKGLDSIKYYSSFNFLKFFLKIIIPIHYIKKK